MAEGTAHGMARQLRQRYFMQDDEVPDDERIKLILMVENVKVYEWPFRDEPKELYCNGVIGLKVGLTRPWRRWLLLHGLAHHLLHVGNQLHLYERNDVVTLARQEYMADLFAGHILLPAALWRVRREPSVATYVVAEEAEVPPECVARWWRLASRRYECLLPTGS